MAPGHLEEPERPHTLYFQIENLSFPPKPLSLKERINIQQQMFNKGHYIYKYEQNPPVKDEI